CRPRWCRPLRYGLPSVSPVNSRSGVPLPQSGLEGNGAKPIGSFGRPIIPDPAGQVFLAHLASSKGQDHGRRLCFRYIKVDAVDTEESIERQQRSTLVAVGKRMIARDTEGIGCRQLVQFGLLV